MSLAVFRQNGTNGTTTVQFATTNLTLVTTNNGIVVTNLGALGGTNYIATNGTLTFSRRRNLQEHRIQLLHDPFVTGDVSFGVSLSNPSAPAQVGPPGLATVVLLDAEAGLSIASTNLVTVANGTAC